MLACIPTQGNGGLDDRVHEHFGSAPSFTLYDTDDDTVTVLVNRNAHHSHGTCHPINRLARHKIDCVVCSGMGRRAVEALNAESISTLQCDLKTVREIAEDLKAGDLSPIDPTRACRGHGQRQSSPDDTGPPMNNRGRGPGGCRNRPEGQGRNQK